MVKTKNIFIKTNIAVGSLLIAFCFAPVANGAVVARPTASAPVAATVSRMPALTTTTTAPAPAVEPAPTPTPAPEPVAAPAPTTPPIANKSNTFTQMFDNANSDTTDNTALADSIAAQRAALDSADNAAAATAANTAASAGTANVCNTALRSCMSDSCGNDFSKCAGDTDQEWSLKMDVCHRKTQCSSDEYAAFSVQIKADRDLNQTLSLYTATMQCGQTYNKCITDACGDGLSTCLSKSGGDAAIAACAAKAKSCIQSDSGLEQRAMTAFANLRVDAEKNISKWKQLLPTFVDEMRNECKAGGGILDERSLECAYSVEFLAGNSQTPYATRKIGAGMAYTCSEDWFGVDVSAFKEEAARITSQQKQAQADLVGAGLGMLGGAVASGGISRAIDTTKAKAAANKADKADDAPADDDNAGGGGK